jgi:hypothetical protein
VSFVRVKSATESVRTRALRHRRTRSGITDALRTPKIAPSDSFQCALYASSKRYRLNCGRQQAHVHTFGLATCPHLSRPSIRSKQRITSARLRSDNVHTQNFLPVLVSFVRLFSASTAMLTHSPAISPDPARIWPHPTPHVTISVGLIERKVAVVAAREGGG